MVFAARLTQRGHAIHSMDELMALYEKAYTADTVKRIASLPHPAVQKFSVITVAVVGASRRFLAQITRHQNEVKFISASLQYSNYAGQADFVVPYEILTASQWVHDFYLKKCRAAMEHYADIGACGISRDAAGYLAPQSLRNVLVISATPYQWKHMIGQRTCRRNTDETRFVLLKIWADLYALDPELFSPELAGPFCQREGCLEKDMSCGCPCEKGALPLDLLRQDIGACGISRDAAGYLAPQSLRNVLIISATPYQWKHMIGQRTCRRNTDETRFVLLKIWADLYALDPELFSPELAGPFCQREGCLEKDMSCGCPCEKGALPLDLLRQDYPAALEGGRQ